MCRQWWPVFPNNTNKKEGKKNKKRWKKGEIKRLIYKINNLKGKSKKKKTKIDPSMAKSLLLKMSHL